MRRALQKSKTALAEYGPTISVHVNRDGTIDGELRVVMGEGYQERYPALIENMPHMLGTWVSVHNYWQPTIEDVFDLSDFLIRRGLAGIATHPVKARRDMAQHKALIARSIVSHIESETEGKYKPLETVIHLRFDSSGKKPKH